MSDASKDVLIIAKNKRI